MKQFIVQVGYTDYALSAEDAVALLAICSRMRAVKRDHYDGPFHYVAGNDLIVDAIRMATVLETLALPDAADSETPSAEPSEEISF